MPFILISLMTLSIPSISSLTVRSFNIVFPVFVTVIVYVISSPAVVTFSLSAILLIS